MSAVSTTGKIITFYSYKGGTGRSMGLANTAWILASNGKRVLTIDWDLEAPGLHRYFHPFLFDKDLTSSDGVIDLVTEYAVRAVTPALPASARSRDERLHGLDVSDYVLALDWRFEDAVGRIDFIPAGRQGSGYSTRVNTFSWSDFYGRLGGGDFLEAVKEQIRSDYDYVLIDSRTGLSDISGICTVHWPDALVVCFTLNRQSIDGAAAVARSVRAQRGSEVRVFPIAMRVELAEQDRLETMREYAREQFAEFLLPDSGARDEYWGQTEVQYVPFYAYEETLATFADRRGRANSLLASMERVTRFVTNGEVQHFRPTRELENRARFSISVGPSRPIIESLAAATTQPANTGDGERPRSNGPPMTYVSHDSADAATLRGLREQLARRGLQLVSHEDRSTLSEPLVALLPEIQSSEAMIVCVSRPALSSWQNREIAYGLARRENERRQNRDFPVVSVLLPGAGETPPSTLATLEGGWVDLRADLEDGAKLDALVAALGGQAVLDRSEVASLEVCPYLGLNAFKEEDAAFFCGREALSQRLFRLVSDQALTALVGPSGSGKSSLVHAGLIPLLRRQAPPLSTWEIVTFRPGRQPFESLGSALVPVLPPELIADGPAAAGSRLADALTSGRISLQALVKGALEPSGADRLLLVVDQLEEVLTMTEEAARRPFIELLLSALPSSPVTILLTLRADVYGDVLRLSRELSDVLARALVNLGPMTPDELARAIEAPAELAGLKLEPGLTTRIVEDVSNEPAGLPILEFALTELCKRREGRVLTHAAYEDLGRALGAIVRRADEVFYSLPESDQIAARWIFTRLVQIAQPGQAQPDSRRPLKRNDLDPEVERVVSRLADERLLVTSRDERGDEAVELAAGALVDGWPRLRGWLDEDRRLVEAADLWERKDRDESLLYGGFRLREALFWERDWDGLDDSVRDFLDAGKQLAERGRIEEERRRELELEVQQRRAEEAVRERELERERRARAEDAAARANQDAKRKNRIIFVGAVAIVAIVSFAVLSLRQTFVANANASEAMRFQSLALARQLAAQSRLVAGDAPDLALLLAAHASWLLRSQTNSDSDPLGFDIRGALLSALSPPQPDVVQLPGPESGVSVGAWSPNGRRLATGGRDGIQLWDPGTGQRIEESTFPQNPEDPKEVTSLAWSSNGLAAGGPGTLRVWTFTPDHPVRELSEDSGGIFLSVAWSADAKRLLSYNANGTLTLWDVGAETSAQIPIELTPGLATAIAWSPDETRVAVGTVDGDIRIWDLASAAWTTPFRADPSGRVSTMSWSPDSGRLATGGQDGVVRIWDIDNGGTVGSPLAGHTGRVTSTAWNEDGALLASGGTDGTLRVWNVESRQPVSEPFHTSGGDVLSVVWSPDGERMASVTEKGPVQVWNLHPRTKLGRAIPVGAGRTSSLAWGPNAGILAVANGNTTTFWDPRDLKEVNYSLVAQTDQVASVSWSPDGSRVATGAANGAIQIWDTKTGQPLGDPLKGHTNSVTTLAWEPGGFRLASGSIDATVKLWDAATGTLLQTLSGTSQVSAVAWSPNRQLAVARADGQVAVWSPSFEQKVDVDAHRLPVLSVAWSADGTQLATGSSDRTIRIWNPETGQGIGEPLRGHAGAVTSIAWGPGPNSRLASGSDDGTVRIWARGDAPTDRFLPLGRPLLGHTAEVKTLSWSVDGRILASGGPRDVWLWNMDEAAWPSLACDAAGRTLTAVEWSTYIAGDKRATPACP